MFRVVIPARYASARLPGKPLLKLAGKPLLQWVFERAQRCAAAEIIIATDDQRIADAAQGFGARVVMTSPSHQSGTDRIAEVAEREGWSPDQIVVNLQGDEPLMPVALIDQVAGLLAQHPHDAIATLASTITALDAFLDPNVVKVVTDAQGRALYFSRAPVPWPRDSAPAGLASQRDFSGARRHIGLYAYRVDALRRLSAAPPSALEMLEKLEQLRALEMGLSIRVAEAQVGPGPDVNTPEDLARVERLL
ncbi:MAG: 3-deoxy-manno-octulosonate cytidylyltransferase [Nevskiaceae bacterium]|jgi:3-deoxy-manno-octulosonate cytidylyltransferase (CMP-KDO synthetase)|nr:3-deoxy-manno-octulosonate cytidylyltransferase [Nevskiaceae bacterium]